MRIKPKGPDLPTPSTFQKILHLGIRLKSLVILTAFLLAGASLYIVEVWQQTPDRLRAPLGDWAQKKGFFPAKNTGGVFSSLLLAPSKVIQFKNARKIPSIHIDIKFKHLQKILRKRAEALESGLLFANSNDFVPASIRHGNRTIKVKLRLKGDHVDHLEGEKKSFRVHVKGDNHIFGLRRFSLQAPWTRDFQGDALFFETLRHVGVLAPNYFFLNVVVNGDDVGIMALEEHFSKELLERNERRESVIIKFDESLYWEHDQNPVFNNFQIAPVKAFRASRIKKSKKLSKDHKVAIGLLRGFVSKALPASEVFDVEQMGRFIAAAELWGAGHAISWHNERFYLNPITLKLEPIGYDASISIRDQGLLTLAGDKLIAGEHLSAKTILDDPKIFEVYSKTLNRLARDIVNGNLLNKLKETEQKILSALDREFFLLSELPWEDLVTRANLLLKKKEPNSKIKENHPLSFSKSFSSILHAFTINDEDGPYLEIVNAIPQPVEIHSIQWVPIAGAKNISFNPTSEVTFPMQLSSTPLRELPQVRRIYYSPQDLDKYHLKVSAKIQGQDEWYESEAIPYFGPLKKHPIPTSSVSEQLGRNSFLTLISEEKEFFVQPGQWSVNGSLIIPAGYGLTINEGTTLRFAKEEKLIARGPLHFRGTENAPILLEGQADEGLWQGLVVLNSDSPSQWSFVTLRNTTGIHHNNWELTGGITFYRSNVEISNCSFFGHRGEDALNIINSKFSLKNVKIENSFSDGFDADFTKGTIEGGLFRNIGKTSGDGVDLSGSQVSINGTSFQKVRDKALSVGERSQVSAGHLSMEDVAIGAASKDGSHLAISNTTITNAENSGLMAYIKKPEYGPATIEASNINFFNIPVKTRAQKGSSITLEGKKIEPEDIDVEQLYKTNMKPGIKK